MQIVNALLEVTSHSEFDISSMTFNFWHHLKRNLTGRYFFETLLVLLEKQPIQYLQIVGIRIHRVDLRCRLKLKEIEECNYSVLRLKFLCLWYV